MSPQTLKLRDRAQPPSFLPPSPQRDLGKTRGLSPHGDPDASERGAPRLGWGQAGPSAILLPPSGPCWGLQQHQDLGARAQGWLTGQGRAPRCTSAGGRPAGSGGHSVPRPQAQAAAQRSTHSASAGLQGHRAQPGPGTHTGPPLPQEEQCAGPTGWGLPAGGLRQLTWPL